MELTVSLMYFLAIAILSFILSLLGYCFVLLDSSGQIHICRQLLPEAGFSGRTHGSRPYSPCLNGSVVTAAGYPAYSGEVSNCPFLIFTSQDLVVQWLSKNNPDSLFLGYLLPVLETERVAGPADY